MVASGRDHYMQTLGPIYPEETVFLLELEKWLEDA
jgi:hypothetical protein